LAECREGARTGPSCRAAQPQEHATSRVYGCIGKRGRLSTPTWKEAAIAAGDGANLLRPRLGRARRLGGVAERRSVALGFRIGVGSRGERDDRAGIRHLNEHLLFEGSYHAQEIAETFDAVGAELNAATSREHTVAVTVTNG